MGKYRKDPILVENSIFFVMILQTSLFTRNTFNEIRRKRQKDPMKTIRMRHFLSPVDIMPLTIRIHKSGNISVAITGQPPFIVAHDSNVLDIKYLSFSYVFLQQQQNSFKYKIRFVVFLNQFDLFDNKVRGVMPKENGFTTVKRIQVEIG